ncbi:MAG TPA: hypothetical protein VJA18_05515, partial [Candidatus Nanoarchaeia archaeon]|nr:hypothetical protein [Candidatus Nanoarchaeia archaeon]
TYDFILIRNPTPPLQPLWLETALEYLTPNTGILAVVASDLGSSNDCDALIRVVSSFSIPKVKKSDFAVVHYYELIEAEKFSLGTYAAVFFSKER